MGLPCSLEIPGCVFGFNGRTLTPENEGSSQEKHHVLRLAQLKLGGHPLITLRKYHILFN